MASSSLRSALVERVLRATPATFEALALDIFRYQAEYNAVYAAYLDLIGVRPAQVKEIGRIPFLPISLFKTHTLQSGQWTPAKIFSSSGTTAATTSRHYLREEALYQAVSRRGFREAYGPLKDYAILALLPAYLEREGSSLVYMADDFIQQSRYSESGFFLHDFEALTARLQQLDRRGVPTVLIGVSFALLDLAEQRPMRLAQTIIMETGGMKGRRQEITRENLHGILQEAFGVKNIHSEYGMTELLSQAYSPGAGVFHPSPTLRIVIRDRTDPFALQTPGKTGGINVIDLANVDTVSFIATDDIGRVGPDQRFEVLGRLDDSDIRGCNLLVQELSNPAGFIGRNGK